MTVATSITTRIKETMKFMSWTKLKTTVVVGVGLLLSAGAIVTFHWIYSAVAPSSDWQTAEISSTSLRRAPRQLLILRTKSVQRSPENVTGGMVAIADGRALGINQSVNAMLVFAYGLKSTHRMVVNTQLPAEKYDLLCNLRAGSKEALQQALQEKFGVIAWQEKRDTDVLLLKVTQTPAPGLQPSTTGGGGMSAGPGHLSIKGQSLSSLAMNLENWFEMPILDQTGLNGRYDVELTFDELPADHPSLEALKQALLEQLGLEVVPGREPLDMLVVDKAQ